MKKHLLIYSILLFIFIFLLSLNVFAHPGRTDANGGHYDSSTGEYHYHHGYTAHQHTNGVCPYDNTISNTSIQKDNTIEQTSEFSLLWIAFIVISVVLLFFLILINNHLFEKYFTGENGKRNIQKINFSYYSDLFEIKNNFSNVTNASIRHFVFFVISVLCDVLFHNSYLEFLYLLYTVCSYLALALRFESWFSMSKEDRKLVKPIFIAYLILFLYRLILFVMCILCNCF